MEIIREKKLQLEIDSESDIGVCRRKSVSLASQLGFDDVKTGEVAILVSELVSNVLKHGGGKGRLTICYIQSSDERKAIEIFACDQGNGILNLAEAINDGYSQKNTLGLGLGTIRRFSDILEIDTQINQSDLELFIDSSNTYKHCIRSVKWLPETRWLGINRSIVYGAASRCKPGETLNGDAYIVQHLSATKTMVAVIDGLGHGKDAHLASNIIKEQILQKSSLPLIDLVKYAHQAAKGTRGAVVGVALINCQIAKIQYVGIGNIEGFVVLSTSKKNLISFGGILGHNIRTPQVFEFPFEKGDTLCMYSDGINSRWNANDIAWKDEPQKNADFLINNYSRPNDDATILIIKHTV